MTVAVEKFTAEVEREGRWWVIHVVELDVVTQAARWSEVEAMARGAVAAELDLDDEDAVALELVPVFDDEAGELLARAGQQEHEARQLAAAASTARRSAVESLRSGGWTLQGIAAGLGISYQRVEQLLKDDRSGPRAEAGHAELTVSTDVSAQRRANRSVTSGRSAGTEVRRASSATHRGVVTGRYVTRSAAHRRRHG